MLISYTTRKGNTKCPSFVQKASNLLLIYYFLWVKSWRWPPLFASHCLKRFTKLSTTRRNSFWCRPQLDPKYYASAPLLCARGSCTRVLPSISTGRNSGPSVPTNVQDMGCLQLAVEAFAKHVHTPSISVCCMSILLGSTFYRTAQQVPPTEEPRCFAASLYTRCSYCECFSPLSS
jgi:hypothetical protein